MAGDSEEGGPIRIPQRQEVSGRQRGRGVGCLAPSSTATVAACLLCPTVSCLRLCLMPVLPATPRCRVASRLKLLAKSRRKQGITRLHLALMPCLENNPVLAAYGAVRSGSAQAVAGAEQRLLHLSLYQGGGGGGGLGSGGAKGGAGISSGAAGVALAAVQEEGEEDGSGGMGGGGGSSAPAANGGAGAGATSAPLQQQMAADAAPAPPGALPGLQLPAAPSMTRTAAHVEAAARLAQYLQSQQRPNRYGYLPIAQEWDIWCAVC